MNMNEKVIGYLAIILGLITFSIEIFGVKLLQLIDMTTNSWDNNAWHYALNAPVFLSMILSLFVVFFGIYLVKNK